MTRMSSQGPRVVIDGRMVGDTLHGFARYVTLMARGLAGLEKLTYEPLFLVQHGMGTRFSGFATHEAAVPFLSPRELLDIPLILRHLKADLWHSPTFSSLLVSPCPSVITIHDLNHLQWGGLKEKLYYKCLLKPFSKKARRVITVSGFSRFEIASWLGIPADEIEVIHNALDPGLTAGVSAEEIERVLKSFGLIRGKYFFCLSNPKPHKNVALLVKAHEKAGGSVSGMPLVLSMNDLPGISGVSGVQFVGALKENETRALLAGAAALFFPSLYEGFGLPPVEAAALGVPLVVSAIPAHREALQDLGENEALWLDPADLPGWSEALAQVAQGRLAAPSPATRAKILERYAVSRLGSGMDRIYRDVLKECL